MTCPLEASEKIAKAVLDVHAAACVNIVPGVRSLYTWRGRVEDAQECLLLIKTRKDLLGELERTVRGAHPYEVPEVIALPITDGYPPYLDWIAESTGGAAERTGDARVVGRKRCGRAPRRPRP